MPDRISPRVYGLAASTALILCASSILALSPRLEQEPRYNDLFCRYLYSCDDYALTRKAIEGLRDGAPIEALVSTLRAAVMRNGASPFHWADLGDAYLANADPANARVCFERALSLGKNFPLIRMRAATFYLRTGDPQTALSYMSGLLKQTSAYDRIVFSYYSRMGWPVSRILEQNGIPADSRAALAWFQYLLANGTPADAARLWDWRCAHALVTGELALLYVHELMDKRQYDAAIHAWDSYLEGLPERPANFLLNAGFEDPPRGTTLDWRIEPSDQVRAEQDCGVAYSGKCSLRIRFDARENLHYQNVSQTIFLKPGNYRFEAFVRTDGITSDQGIRFHLADPENPARLDVITDSVTGATDWRPIRKAFTVPPGVRLVIVRIARLPSDKFENQIKGTAWLDQVSIVADGG